MSLLNAIRATFLRPKANKPRSDTEILTALSEFLDIFDTGGLMSSIGPGLQCKEVEALADLYRAAGTPDIAEDWIKVHAVEDDCGDEHCRCGAPDCGVEINAA